MKELLDSQVAAIGEAVLLEADGRIKSLKIRDIEGLEQPSVPETATPTVKPKSGRELLEALRASGLVGMWRDREDIGAGSGFARKLRDRAQKREHDRP